MTVSLSCTSFSFPALPLPDVIRLVALLKITAIDLCIAEGARDVRTADVLADPRGLAAVHRRLCAAAGLAVQDVFAHLGTGPADRPINVEDAELAADNVRRLDAYLQYAQAVGSPGLTLSPGAARDDPARQRSIDRLRLLVDRAGEYGLAVSVEPHLGSVASTVAEATDLCRAVPGLALTLDHSHFIAQGIDQQSVHPLFALARHTHVRQAAQGRLQCPGTEGVLDLKGLLVAARDAGFDGSFALEYVNSPMWDMNRLDVVTETVRLRDALLEIS